MKKFKIWMEGYAATGESGSAHYIGSAEGETFEEACKNYRDKEGKPLGLDKHYHYPSIWACRLFDNEQDARKSFG